MTPAGGRYSRTARGGQPCAQVERKVTSIGKFHTATCPPSAEAPDAEDSCVMPSSTPFITVQSSPIEKA
eukprot:scaffold57076_cov66-Phaeocystis_antarctica.AAC.6